MPPTPKFFITHSWKDIDFAKRLCDDLRANGLGGFFDAYSVKPGDIISAEITHGARLRRSLSCHCNSRGDSDCRQMTSAKGVLK
jgi:hypothetical protein